MSLSLVENVIVAGAENHPPMLDKTMFSSWVSHMLLYIKGKENGKLLIDSVLIGPFQYGTITEPGTLSTPAIMRARTYDELTDAEKLRDACDIKAKNIVLQGLPQDIYNLPEWSESVTDVKLAKDLHGTNFDQLYAYLRQHEAHANEVRLVAPSFLPSDYPISNLNKAMAFISTTFTSRYPPINNQLRTSSNPTNQATIQDGRVTMQIVKLRLFDATIVKKNAIWQDNAPNLNDQGILHDAFDFDYDEAPSASVVLMAKLSSYDLEVLLEVPTPDNDKDNIVIHQGNENGKLLIDSVLNGPFQFGTVVVPGDETTPATVKERTFTDLTNEEKLRESVDIKATNIVLQGSELSLQERGSKLYDEFDTFTSTHGESNHSHYMWFAQLINDMRTLARDMHSTNFDHLYAYLRQHEAHTNEVRLMRQRYPDPMALYYSPPASQRSYDVPMVQQSSYQPQVAHPLPVVHHQPYQAPAIQQQAQASFSQLDSGLVVPSFLPSDDPIASLNKAVAFLSRSFASCYPPTNNQLRTSFNSRNQASIQDERVTMQTVQGRQKQGYANSEARSNATSQGINRNREVNITGQERVVKCYNFQEEDHMARQCTKPKRPKNSAWFKEKMLLTEALESGATLDAEQLAFLEDNGDTFTLVQAS
ncbi:hypothetical protein Tco_0457952 [Tanacetum coccineum]